MPTPITLTRANVIEALAMTVAAYGPDHTDDSVCYVVDGAPSCLIGAVLHRLGIDIETLGRPYYVDLPVDDLLADLADRYVVASSGIPAQRYTLISFPTSDDRDDVTLALHTAQDHQDGGDNWGQAYQAARTAIDV